MLEVRAGVGQPMKSAFSTVSEFRPEHGAPGEGANLPGQSRALEPSLERVKVRSRACLSRSRCAEIADFGRYESMMHLLEEFRSTIVASVLAIAMVLTAALTNIDFLKLNIPLMSGIEKNEVDDLLVGFALLLIGLTFDLVYRRKRRELELAAQKLQTLKSTMRTVQDIVNNFLNYLLLFEMDARGKLPSDSFELLDKQVRETYEKLNALANVDSVRETALGGGVGIDYPDPEDKFLRRVATESRED